MSIPLGVEPDDSILCPICHRDSCEDHLPAEPAGRPRLVLQRAHAMMAMTPPEEIIEGIAWAGRLSVLVAESGGGKTFMLLDKAAHVSAGLPWHGRHTLQGSVAYFSFEGDALGLRLSALSAQGHRLDHVYITSASEPLSPRINRDGGEERSIGEVAISEALDALVADLALNERPPLRLIIIDTVRASLTGSEDSSESVAAYQRAVRRVMARAPGAAAILAHHAGWQDGDTQRKRERGSSAWRGNADVTLYLEAGAYDAESGSAELTLRTLKVRDSERPAPLHLIRRRVYLDGSDRHGQPVTSCVIESDRRTREDREKEQHAAADAEARKTDLAVLRAMRDCPQATSISRLRTVVGLRTDAVQAAVARVVRRELAVEGRRGQPYTVTAAGHAAIDGGGDAA